MKRSLLGVLVFVSFGCYQTARSEPVDVSGRWLVQQDRDFRGSAAVPTQCTFTQKQTELSVTCGSGTEMKGGWRDATVSWGVEKTVSDDRIVVLYSGELGDAGRSIKGTWKLTSSVLDEKGTFEARKIK
jgi:hypothetical protein